MFLKETFLEILSIYDSSNIKLFKMKNKTFYTALVYWFLALGLVLFLSGCRTKKSTTDIKQIETENVSIVDNSTIDKKEVEKENIISRTSSEWSDKSFLEAWLQIKSDVAVLEDRHGNRWTFTNPELTQKQTQSNDIVKSEQIDTRSDKVTEIKENQQKETDVRLSKETNTDVSEKHSSKGKEPVW